MRKLPKLSLLLFLTGLLFISGCKKDKSTDNNKAEYTLGLMPSPVDSIKLIPVIDTSILFHSRQNSRIQNLPSEYSLDMPEIRNQGSEGSCVAFAFGYAARSYLLHKAQNVSYFIEGTTTVDNNKVFSPEFLYNNSKVSGDCGAGTYMVSALNFLQNNGICTWASMPYSSANGCSALGTQEQQQNAALFKIIRHWRFTDISKEFIKQVLYYDNPVIIGVRVDNGFQQLGSKVWNNPSGAVLGGHAMVLCGWDDTKNAFKMMNSWGTYWGDKGFGWVDYNYLSKVLMGSPGYYEMYVMYQDYDSTLIPKITTTVVDNISSTTARTGGNIVSSGAANIIESGICYATNPAPTINNTKINSGVKSGIFVSNLIGLTANATYYVRAYAINAYGVAYGNEISFTTTSTATLPTLTTTAISNITTTTASSGGNITNQGSSAVTARGVCYSTSPTPTISNSKTTNGTGTGSFTSAITGLSANTTYYVRAYATNSTGTAYGNEVSFKAANNTTPENPYLNPNLTYGSVTDIDGNKYATIRIGTQVWMAENLKVSKYNDGTAIPNITGNDAWYNLNIGAWVFYKNDTINNILHGKIYNWHAINTGKLCPQGWHVPNNTEWSQLHDFLGGDGLSGIKTKSTGNITDGTGLWKKDSYYEGTNESGFTALPSGVRFNTGQFTDGPSDGKSTNWWSSSEESNADAAWYRGLGYTYGNLARGYTSKEEGYSCRCVKD